MRCTHRAGRSSPASFQRCVRRVEPWLALCAAGVLLGSSIAACGDDDNGTNTATGIGANQPGGAGAGGTATPGGPGTNGTAGAAGSGILGMAGAAGSGTIIGGAGAGTGMGGGGMTAGTGTVPGTENGTSGAVGVNGSATASGSTGSAGAAATTGSGSILATADAGVDAGMDAGQGLDAGVLDAARALSDSEIAFAVDILNSGEIDQAQAALPRLARAEVQAFANHMIADHWAALAQLRSIELSENINEAQSTFAGTLKQGSDTIVTGLQKFPVGSVDTLYVNSQVVSHRLALEAVDGFIAGADDAALRGFLNSLRTTIQAHLAEALTLQASNATASP